LREAKPPRPGRETLGRRRWEFLRGNFQEFLLAKRERGEAAKSVSSLDEGNTVGRRKPRRGSTRDERKRGRRSARTPGESKALEAKKGPCRET
jgi:hypothetical protein